MSFNGFSILSLFVNPLPPTPHKKKIFFKPIGFNKRLLQTECLQLTLVITS